MKRFFICLLVLVAINVNSGETYFPNSGDSELNEMLISLNNNRIDQQAFIKKLSMEFNIPDIKIKNLFTHYEMTPADVLMSVSISDVSGQPLNTVSGLYFKNKKSGWVAVLDKLNISKKSMFFKQIKKDVRSLN